MNLLDQQAPITQPPVEAAPSEPFVPRFPSVIDSSILAAWKSCPSLFRLGYIEHWKAKGESVHLVAGKAFARGLEVARDTFFVQNRSAEDAIALGLQALIAEYGDFECPPDQAKSLPRMCGAFEFYFENYPLRRDEMPPITLAGGKQAIEFSFAHPLPISNPETGDPLLFCGRMDAILDYDHAAMICDEKTTGQLGATWSRQWDLRGQFMGYAWGCREAGIKVAGAVIRGVSILKTKYETQQAIIFHPDWMIERWFQETCGTVHDMVAAWTLHKLGSRVGFKHNFGDACSAYGGCQFRQACSTQNEAPWLETYFERREWNPLLRTEKKL